MLEMGTCRLGNFVVVSSARTGFFNDGYAKLAAFVGFVVVSSAKTGYFNDGYAKLAVLSDFSIGSQLVEL